MLHSEDPLDDPLDLTEPGRPRRRLRHAGDHADSSRAGSEVLGKAPEEDRIRRRFRFEGIEHEVIGQHHGERTGTTQRSHEAVLPAACRRGSTRRPQRGLGRRAGAHGRDPAALRAKRPTSAWSPDLGWRLRQHEPGTGQRPAPRGLITCSNARRLVAARAAQRSCTRRPTGSGTPACRHSEAAVLSIIAITAMRAAPRPAVRSRSVRTRSRAAKVLGREHRNAIWRSASVVDTPYGAVAHRGGRSRPGRVGRRPGRRSGAATSGPATTSHACSTQRPSTSPP